MIKQNNRFQIETTNHSLSLKKVNPDLDNIEEYKYDMNTEKRMTTTTPGMLNSETSDFRVPKLFINDDGPGKQLSRMYSKDDNYP